MKDHDLALDALSPSTLLALSEIDALSTQPPGYGMTYDSSRKPDPVPFFDVKRRIWTFLDEKAIACLCTGMTHARACVRK